jgi:hypothetical protein
MRGPDGGKDSRVNEFCPRGNLEGQGGAVPPPTPRELDFLPGAGWDTYSD